MGDRKLKLHNRCFKRRTLAMPVTTALKTLRGWRYVELMKSIWPIAVFAEPIAITAVSARPEMDPTLDMFFSASWISLTIS